MPSSFLFGIQFICLSLLLSSPCLGEEKAVRDYEKQKERLSHESSPLGKVKILIKMSELDLEEVTRFVKKEDFIEADKLLSRYHDVIVQADETLKASHRNAQKNPAGFREFEISLRKQLRKLADLKFNYPFDQQEKINQAIVSAKSAHEDMLQAIFGQENTRRAKARSEKQKNSQ